MKGGAQCHRNDMRAIARQDGGKLRTTRERAYALRGNPERGTIVQATGYLWQPWEKAT